MKHSAPAFLALLGLGIAVSCSRDSPVEVLLQPPEVSPQSATDQPGPALKVDGEALSIQDLPDDPLFQNLVASIDEPSLSEPLLAAVEALTSGQVARATNLINRASAVADELEDGPLTEARLYWSAIERFFEEAELL